MVLLLGLLGALGSVVCSFYKKERIVALNSTGWSCRTDNTQQQLFFDQNQLINACTSFLSLPACTLSSVEGHSNFWGLNGNNGEWTGSDDVKTGVDGALEQLKDVSGPRGGGKTSYASKASGKNSRHKQGITSAAVHQKPVGGGRNDSEDFSERPAGAAVHPAKKRELDRADKDKSTPKEEKPKDEILIVQADRIRGGSYVGWDGQQLCRIMGDLAYGMETGIAYKVVAAGTVVQNVKSGHTGYIVVNPTCDKKCIAVPSIVMHSIDDFFTLEGEDYNPRNYTVFMPFMMFLQTKVSTPTLSDTHRNMALASMNRHFHTPEYHAMFVDTYNYYFHYNKYRIYRQVTGKGKVVVETRDRLVDCEMVRYGEVRLDADVGRHDSLDCPVADNYHFRPDCVLVFKNSTEPDTIYFSGNVHPERPEAYPKFQTSEVGANSNKYYRSIYTGFYPEDATPFVTYSVNAINACKALKRMCAIRESAYFDEQLTSLQYAAFARIFFSDDLDWVANSEEASLSGKPGWRKRFCTVARLRFKDGPEQDCFGSVVVGDAKRLAHFSESLEFKEAELDTRVHGPLFYPTDSTRRSGYGDPHQIKNLQVDVNIIKPVEYFNPVNFGYSWTTVIPNNVCEALGFEAFEQVRRGSVYDWFYDNKIRFRQIYKQMKAGFRGLMEDFNRGVLEEYAESHPKWIYRSNFSNFTTFLSYQESRQELGVIPHIKKALRHMFVERQVEHTPDDNMTRFVDAKVKKEFAKQGKVPRLYVTYDAGCMYANELPEYAKICLDGCRTYTRKGVTFHVNIFAKPTTPGLVKALNDLINCMSRRDEVYILIYSDDSVWAGNLNGVDFAFNVDISSCDSGNKGGVFGLIFMLLSQFSPELAMGLVSQCSNVIKLTNPENADEKCEIHMSSFFEGSGTVLTTILNHVAMFMISQAAVVILSDMAKRICHWEEIGNLVVKCGEAFGHVLTVEAAKSDHGFVPEKIQFLKRSPLRLTTGEYVPVMNYGTIFRGFGSIEGDLTADMVGMSVVEFAQLGVEERANVFLSGVVAGLKNEPNSIILSALRRRFALLPGSLAGVWDNLDTSRFALQSSNVLGDEPVCDASGVVSTESLCRRYDLNHAQLHAFAGKISNCRIGSLYPDQCVGSFARTDYGCGNV